MLPHIKCPSVFSGATNPSGSTSKISSNSLLARALIWCHNLRVAGSSLAGAATKASGNWMCQKEDQNGLVLIEQGLRHPENQIQLLWKSFDYLPTALQGALERVLAELTSSVETLSQHEQQSLVAGAPYCNGTGMALLQNWQVLVLAAQPENMPEFQEAGKRVENALRDGTAALPGAKADSGSVQHDDCDFNHLLAEYCRPQQLHENYIALPVNSAVQLALQGIQSWLPSTAVFSLLKDFFAGKLTPDALKAEMMQLHQEINSEFGLAEYFTGEQTLLALLERINSVLGQSVKRSSQALAIAALAGGTLPGVAMSLMTGALVMGVMESIQNKLREYVGKPEQEGARVLEELIKLNQAVQLERNIAAIRYKSLNALEAAVAVVLKGSKEHTDAKETNRSLARTFIGASDEHVPGNGEVESSALPISEKIGVSSYLQQAEQWVSSISLLPGAHASPIIPAIKNGAGGLTSGPAVTVNISPTGVQNTTIPSQPTAPLLKPLSWNETQSILIGQYSIAMGVAALDNMDTQDQRRWLNAQRNAVQKAGELGLELKAIPMFETKVKVEFDRGLAATLDDSAPRDSSNIYVHWTEYPDVGTSGLKDPTNLESRVYHHETLWGAAKKNFPFTRTMASYFDNTFFSSSSDRNDSSAQINVPAGGIINYVQSFNVGARVQAQAEQWFPLGIGNGTFDDKMRSVIDASFRFSLIEAQRQVETTGVTSEIASEIKEAWEENRLRIVPLAIADNAVVRPRADKILIPAYLLNVIPKASLSSNQPFVVHSEKVFSYIPGAPQGALNLHNSRSDAGVYLNQQYVTNGSNEKDAFLAKRMPRERAKTFLEQQKIIGGIRPESFRLVELPQDDKKSSLNTLMLMYFRQLASTEMTDNVRSYGEANLEVLGEVAETLIESMELILLPLGFASGMPGFVAAGLLAPVGLIKMQMNAAEGKSSGWDGLSLLDLLDSVQESLDFVPAAGKIAKTAAALNSAKKISAAMGNPVILMKNDGVLRLWDQDWTQYASASVDTKGWRAGDDGLVRTGTGTGTKTYAQLTQGHTSHWIEVQPVPQGSTIYRVVSAKTELPPLTLAYDVRRSVWIPQFDDVSRLNDAQLLHLQTRHLGLTETDAMEVIEIAQPNREILENIWKGSMTSPAWLNDAIGRQYSQKALRDLEEVLSPANTRGATIAVEAEVIVAKALATLTNRPVRIRTHNEGLTLRVMPRGQNSLNAAMPQGNDIDLVRQADNHFVLREESVPDIQTAEDQFSLLEVVLRADSKLGGMNDENFSGMTLSAAQKKHRMENTLAAVKKEISDNSQEYSDVFLASSGRGHFKAKGDFVQMPSAEPEVVALIQEYPALSRRAAEELLIPDWKPVVRDNVKSTELKNRVDTFLERQKVQAGLAEIYAGHIHSTAGESVLLDSVTSLPDWPQNTVIKVSQGGSRNGRDFQGNVRKSYGALTTSAVPDAVKVVEISPGVYRGIGSEGSSEGEFVSGKTGLSGALLQALTDDQRTKLGINIGDSQGLFRKVRQFLNSGGAKNLLKQADLTKRDIGGLLPAEVEWQALQKIENGKYSGTRRKIGQSGETDKYYLILDGQAWRVKSAPESEGTDYLYVVSSGSPEDRSISPVYEGRSTAIRVSRNEDGIFEKTTLMAGGVEELREVSAQNWRPWDKRPELIGTQFANQFVLYTVTHKAHNIFYPFTPPRGQAPEYKQRLTAGSDEILKQPTNSNNIAHKVEVFKNQWKMPVDITAMSFFNMPGDIASEVKYLNGGLIAGLINKGVKHNNPIIRRVIEPMAGSGFYSNYVRALGFKGDMVVNDINPLITYTQSAIVQYPEKVKAYIDSIQKNIADLWETRFRDEEGGVNLSFDPVDFRIDFSSADRGKAFVNSLQVGRFREEVKSYVWNMIDEYFIIEGGKITYRPVVPTIPARLSEEDAGAFLAAAFYLMQCNSAGNRACVVINSSDSVALPIKLVTTNRRQVNLFSSGVSNTNGISYLSYLHQGEGQKATQFVNGDGWETLRPVDGGTNEGDLAILSGHFSDRYGSEKEFMKKIKDNVVPFVNNGGRIIITNSPSDYKILAFEQLGFHVFTRRKGNINYLMAISKNIEEDNVF